MEYLKKIYIDRLPLYGLATDDFQYGQWRLSKEYAIKKAMIQHNPKNSIGILAYDIDTSTAAYDWDDRDAPPPNIIVLNRDNGHAHLLYILETPVHNNEKSSERALNYVSYINAALTKRLGADPGYNQLVSKNPLSDKWITIYQRDDLYSLDELADWVEKELSELAEQRAKSRGKKYKPIEQSDESPGRNVTLFNQLRVWAYRERRRPDISEVEFFDSVLQHAHSLNTDGLPNTEVRSVAKSVSRWVWKNISPEAFRAAQKRLSDKAGKKRHEKAVELHKRIVEAVEQCPELTQEDIGAMFGVSRRTVIRALKEHKATETETTIEDTEKEYNVTTPTIQDRGTSLPLPSYDVTAPISGEIDSILLPEVMSKQGVKMRPETIRINTETLQKKYSLSDAITQRKRGIIRSFCIVETLKCPDQGAGRLI